MALQPRTVELDRGGTSVVSSGLTKKRLDAFSLVQPVHAGFSASGTLCSVGAEKRSQRRLIAYLELRYRSPRAPVPAERRNLVPSRNFETWRDASALFADIEIADCSEASSRAAAKPLRARDPNAGSVSLLSQALYLIRRGRPLSSPDIEGKLDDIGARRLRLTTSRGVEVAGRKCAGTDAASRTRWLRRSSTSSTRRRDSHRQLAPDLRA